MLMARESVDFQILVSIVVPVYNVEEYLSRCIASLCNQSYTNLEIILVDDGSTDSSGDICDWYKNSDQRIEVLHQSNGGLSEARNTGINAARGEYLAFVDSDDFIDEKYIDMLLNLALTYDAQIAVCDYYKGGKDKFPEGRRKPKVWQCTAENMLRNWHGKYKRLETIACNKLYKRELFTKSGIRYPKGYYHEDIQTTHLLVNEANKVVFTDEKLYYYFQRNGSITSTGSVKRLGDCIYGQKRRYQWFKNNGYQRAYEVMCVKSMEFCIYNYAVINDSIYEQIGERLIEQYMRYAKKAIHFKKIGVWEKLLLFFMKKGYRWIRKIVQTFIKCKSK